jgi:y4mF family transcriptional regulator
MDSQAAILAQQLGTLIRQRRKEAGMQQAELALVSGTGIRFIVDLEAGKPSCQLGKALAVAAALGITVSVIAAPDAAPTMPDFP